MTWVFESPAASPFAPPRRAGADVAIWLWSLAALILLMVLLGGATRLTESGLSITEWKPLTGVVPPLTPEQWAAEFENYRKIPQYAQVFPDMELSGFKIIYFFEWSHRLLGRVIGLFAILPMIWFWARGRLPSRLKPQLVGLVALGALQGFVGWWMVKSGLTLRTEVAQERLAIHLLLASLTFAWTVWIAAGETFRARDEDSAPGARIFAFVLLALVFVQIFFGGLVAGLRAGRVYMTWPLIEGRFLPPAEELAALSPLWRNVLDNILTVQVEHRLTAYLLFGLALAQAAWLAIEAGASSRATRRALVFLALVVAQAGVGIATLLLAVPLWAGLAHQGFAMVVLAAAVLHAQALTRDA